MLKREFRDLTVKEAIRDLEPVLDLGDRKRAFEKYNDRLVNELPFDELGELCYNVVGCIVDNWFVEMASFGEEGVAHYKQEFEDNNVPWLEYRKYVPCHPLLTSFAMHHIEELSLAYAMFDTYVHHNQDNPEIFKKYDFEGPEKKLGPFKLKGKKFESDFLDDLKVEVHMLVYTYYCYGKHPYETDDIWEHLKSDTASVVQRAIEIGDEQENEGFVII